MPLFVTIPMSFNEKVDLALVQFFFQSLRLGLVWQPDWQQRLRDEIERIEEGKAKRTPTRFIPKFDEQSGLVVTIIQDWKTKEVLMQAFMNEESWKKTLASKEVWFWSRSRSCLWHKGETSGNIMAVKEIRFDCDCDSILILTQVQGDGLACHEGRDSCYVKAENLCSSCGGTMVIQPSKEIGSRFHFIGPDRKVLYCPKCRCYEETAADS